jgi:competence protein ComEA
VPELSRSQLIVYGAVAAVLLLVGARWIRSTDARGTSPGGVTFSSGSNGSPGGGSSVSVAQGGEDVVVDVTGRVREPGVYRLPAGSRVEDAVQRAGGPEAGADIEAINLAARLSDGQQISIPARAKSPVGVGLGSGTGGAAVPADPAAAGPINFGTATPAELDTIEGIGPVTAQKLLEYRQQHGGISSVDDLDQIDGIGPATIEALKARLQP